LQALSPLFFEQSRSEDASFEAIDNEAKIYTWYRLNFYGVCVTIRIPNRRLPAFAQYASMPSAEAPVQIRFLDKQVLRKSRVSHQPCNQFDAHFQSPGPFEKRGLITA
jgi:hypothetical protein